MRYKEINQSPIIDVMDSSITEMHNIMQTEQRALYENNESVIQYQSFIDRVRESVSSTPIVGQQYVPLSLNSTPIAHLIIVTQSTRLMEFVKQIDKKYQFKLNNQIIKFPAASDTSMNLGDLQLDTFLFKDVDSVEQTITMLSLTFSNWHIRYNKV